jgi:hypothetical protein
MPTLDQYMRAIAKAEAAGDAEAASVLKQRAAAAETGAGGWREQLGAGMQDVIKGVGQKIGVYNQDDIKEQNRIADMATGGTVTGNLTRGVGAALPAIAAGVLAPGVGTSIAGGAALGGANAALLGTEKDSVLQGTAENALEGAAWGAGGNALLKAAAPAARAGGRVLRNALGRVEETIPLRPGSAQRVAERAFREQAGDQAQNIRGALQTTPPTASGAPLTTGASVRGLAAHADDTIAAPARSIMESERLLRETGGGLADPLKGVSNRARQAQWDYLENSLRADVPALADAAEQVNTAFKGSANFKTRFDPRDRIGDTLDMLTDLQQNEGIKGELARIARQYRAAHEAGDIESLHQFRMTALDDALSRLHSSDRNASKIARNIVRDIKDEFDDSMERALGNKSWQRYLAEYRAAAQAREQGRAGNAALERLSTRKETPGGVPSMTGAESQLKGMAQQVDDFGNSVYSPQASTAMREVAGEVAAEASPYAFGPRGSATSQNAAAAQRVLKSALAASARRAQGVSGRDVTAGIGGTIAGGPVGGVAMVGLNRVIDNHAIRIGERLAQIYANPDEAIRALDSMRLPSQQRAAVMQYLQQRAQQIGQTVGPALPATLGAMAAQRQ